MQQVPTEVLTLVEPWLQHAGVPAPQRPEYHKWVRFYLDFCHKYGHPTRSLTSLGPFLTKLAAENQSVGQRRQASIAVRLLLQPDPASAWWPSASPSIPPPQHSNTPALHYSNPP